MRVSCETEGVTLLAEISNASCGGMFITTSAPIALNQQLKIAIKQLDTVANAVVKWTRQGTTLHAPSVRPQSATAYIYVRPRSSPPPGIGVEIVDFERGGDIYGSWVERHSQA